MTNHFSADFFPPRTFFFQTTQRQSSGSAYFKLSPLPTTLRRADSQGRVGASLCPATPRSSTTKRRGSSRASFSFRVLSRRGVSHSAQCVQPPVARGSRGDHVQHVCSRRVPLEHAPRASLRRSSATATSRKLSRQRWQSIFAARGRTTIRSE